MSVVQIHHCGMLGVHSEIVHDARIEWSADVIRRPNVHNLIILTVYS